MWKDDFVGSASADAFAERPSFENVSLRKIHASRARPPRRTLRESFATHCGRKHTMCARIASFFLVVTTLLITPAWSRAEAAAASNAQLELQANSAFTRGQYEIALPILTKLRDVYASEPERLGPINEKIRVCEKAVASLKKTAAAAVPLMPGNEPTSA